MKTVKGKLIIVACVLPLLFMACGKDDNNPIGNNAPFTFLKVGNEWEYGVYDNEGELLRTFKRSILYENKGYFRILEDDNVNSPPYYWYVNR